MRYPKRSQCKHAKSPYRVRNWANYETGLQGRGSLTVWLSDTALEAWRAPATGRPGGQRTYSDLAIEAALTIRTVFHLPLRQTEGFLRSLSELLELGSRPQITPRSPDVFRGSATSSPGSWPETIRFTSSSTARG